MCPLHLTGRSNRSKKRSWMTDKKKDIVCSQHEYHKKQIRPPLEQMKAVAIYLDGVWTSSGSTALKPAIGSILGTAEAVMMNINPFSSGCPRKARQRARLNVNPETRKCPLGWKFVAAYRKTRILKSWECTVFLTITTTTGTDSLLRIEGQRKREACRGEIGNDELLSCRTATRL